MAADSNMGYHQDAFLASVMNRHAISFQSGAISSTSGMIPTGNSLGVNSTSTSILTGNSSMINTTSGITSAGNSSGGLLHDSVSGLKHETELAVDWSIEEQSRLDEGLVMYASEPNIMRYIKIAATLHDKTVRDVALRCHWMTKGKRRKPDEHYTGKKVKERKDNLVESSSMANVPSAPPPNMASFPPMMHHMDQNDRISCEVPAVGSTTRHLLDENAQAFSQITANLATQRIQDNIDLFRHTRNNIATILNAMRDMPGIMSQMPPLPESINEELAHTILSNTAQIKDNIDLFRPTRNNSATILKDMREMPGIMSQMPPLPESINEELTDTILSNTAQGMIFSSPGGIHMKQEPKC